MKQKKECDALLPSAVHEGQNTRHAHRDAMNLFLLCFELLVSDNASVVLIS